MNNSFYNEKYEQNENNNEDKESEKILKGQPYVNWVGTLDFSPVRSNNTTTCANPYWAIASA